MKGFRNAAERAKPAYLINTQHISQPCIFFKTVQFHLYSISNILSNLNNSLRANQPLISCTTFDERLINKNQTSNRSHFASGLILGKSCVAGEGLMLFSYFGPRVEDHPLPQRRSLSLTTFLLSISHVHAFTLSPFIVVVP